MLETWLLSLLSAGLTTYVIAGEIKLIRIERVPVDYAIHLLIMWTLTLISWAFVIAAWHPFRF